jgi:hypothetical protein
MPRRAPGKMTTTALRAMGWQDDDHGATRDGLVHDDHGATRDGLAR